MEDFKPYVQYKLTGIEWIGEIPKHWEVNKLKFLAEVHSSNVDKKSKEEEANVLLCNYVDVYKNEFINSQISFMESTAPDPQIEKFQLRQGDVLVTKDSEDPKDIAVPAFVEEDLENTLCGYHLAMIRPKRIDGEFLFRLFESKNFNSHFEKGAKGITRYGLSMRIFNNAHIPIPGVDEQRKIARFLRNKTQQIDTTITKLQRLIELLQEERAALINEAVTKGLRGDAAKAAGLNPDPPMKDSGVAWIGEVPAHWEVVWLKYLSASIQTGPFGSQLHATDYVKNGIPVINPANIVDGQIVPDWQCSITEEKFNELNRHRLSEGDIIFGRRGEMGRCALVKKEEDGWICGTGSIRVSPDPQRQRIKPEFLTTFLQSKFVKELLSLSSVGTTMANLNTTILGEIPVTTPPIKEQSMIIAFLLHEDEAFRNNISSIKQEITLLQEYRQALISEVVTGKIDVRDYPIPEAED